MVAAARDLFVEHDYAATTVAEIARAARGAVDTVYATVGRKPAPLRGRGLVPPGRHVDLPGGRRARRPRARRLHRPARGLPRAFRATGSGPVRYLALTLPGNAMGLYDEVGEPAPERRLPDGGVTARASPAGRPPRRATGCG
ncbi:MAG: helix-turn-helix transcriptional regulator [Pseudonocardia sp.]|nr:helix-turn-helix transcriptional regulator [Pseudonocardia sp.]